MLVIGVPAIETGRLLEVSRHQLNVSLVRATQRLLDHCLEDVLLFTSDYRRRVHLFRLDHALHSGIAAVNSLRMEDQHRLRLVLFADVLFFEISFWRRVLGLAAKGTLFLVSRLAALVLQQQSLLLSIGLKQWLVSGRQSGRIEIGLFWRRPHRLI